MDTVRAFLEHLVKHQRPLLGAAGVALLILSFIQAGLDASGHWSGAILTLPRWPMFVMGALFFLVAAVWARLAPPVSQWTRANLEKGLNIPCDDLHLEIKVGSLLDLDGTGRSTGIVLPANTSFIDDCITDPKSALGSFALKHFPHKLDDFRSSLRQHLPDHTSDDAAHGPQWPPGTTVVFEAPSGAAARLVVTAATARSTGAGIRATPSAIAACICEIFRCTLDSKIDHVRMPLIGTGHGGVALHHALTTCIVNVEHFARTHHHIKRFEVVVLNSDVDRLVAAYGATSNSIPWQLIGG